MSDENFEPRHADMGRHVASGILNSGMAQIIKVVCQFGSIVILSRLLPPTDFGIIAMAGPIYGFVMLFQDLGLGQATIQRADIKHGEVNTFFWINIAVGLLLTLVLVLLSPLAGWYYKDQRVVPLTAAMGLLVFISAFGTQHGAILQRRMQFKAGAFLEAAGTLGGLIVSIVAAYILKGYWALYFGIAAGTIIPVIGIWWIIRWRPTSPQIISGTKDMLRFGAGITTTNLTNFLARNMDNVLIGRRWGEQELGLYDRAYKLLLFPLQRIVYPVGAIMVPVLSRLMSEPDRYRAIYLKTIKQLAFVTWPGIIWAAVLSDPLIPTLLGKNWEGTAPIFQFLAAAGLMQAFGGITGPLFVSQGRSGDMAKWSILSAAISIGAFLIGLPYGALGVAAAYAIVECVRSPFGWWWATHKGPIKPEDIFWASVPLVAGGIGAGLAVYALKIYVRLPPLFLLASGLIAAYVAASLMMCLFKDGRDTLRHSLAVAESLLKRIISKESY